MQIFTFDMTLATMSAKRGFWPGLVIHDSQHRWSKMAGKSARHCGPAMSARRYLEDNIL